MKISQVSFYGINRENNKCQAARIKIVKSHFIGKDINTQIFTDMDSRALPSAIAWMGQDGMIHYTNFLAVPMAIAMHQYNTTHII